MILEIKNEFERVAGLIGATFVSKSESELEDFVQGYDFDPVTLINLSPLLRYRQETNTSSGALTYDIPFNLKFLTKFQKEDTLEDTKDVLIDEMIKSSENFFRELNKNESLLFISVRMPANINILRQYTSNLTCGIDVTISIDTACNRIPIA